MSLKHAAVSLFVATVTFGTQAYAANPERNDWLQADYGTVIIAASATVSKSADASATIFPNLTRVSQ